MNGIYRSDVSGADVQRNGAMDQLLSDEQASAILDQRRNSYSYCQIEISSDSRSVKKSLERLVIIP